MTTIRRRHAGRGTRIGAGLGALAAFAVLAGCASPKTAQRAAPDAARNAEKGAPQRVVQSEGAQSEGAQPQASLPEGARPASPYARALVIAEEPRAALIARDILEQGGSPADAAVAASLALSVTYPAAVSLGGGGLCLYHDPDDQIVASLNFLPQAPATPGPVAVPGLLKGLDMVHRRWGRLPWGQLAGPAEQLAVTGAPVSKALARRLAGAEGDAQRLAVLGGAVPETGDRLVQRALATTLGRLRLRGASDAYTGAVARSFVTGMAVTGGTVSLEDLARYKAHLRPAQSVVLADRTVVYAPSMEVGAGALAADVLARFTAEGSKAAQSPGLALAHTRAALESFGLVDAGGTDYGTTGFLILDARGAAIACGLTLNGLLGDGQVGPADGILRARAPRADDRLSLAGAFLAPLFVFTGRDQGLRSVAIGTGTPDGLAAAYGPSASGAFAPALDAAQTGGYGRAHLIQCAAPDGDGAASKKPDAGLGRCTLAPDPRSAGLALEALDRLQRTGAP